MRKDLKTHCHLSMTVIDKKTGEQRQLTQQEIAKRLEKILALSPLERVRMGHPTTLTDTSERAKEE